jgi:hypothetical protein
MLSVRWKLRAAFCAVLFVASSARAATPALAQIELRVRRLEALVGQARFREAAEEAPTLRSQALALPPGSAARLLLVRTEIAAATAALALRHEGNAQVCLHRALQLEPGLALGASAAPKLRRTLEAMREQS